MDKYRASYKPWRQPNSIDRLIGTARTVTFKRSYRIPGPHALSAIVAPMSHVSGPELVSGCCKAGVISTFPSINAFTTGLREDWLLDIEVALAGGRAAMPEKPLTPYAVDLIMHSSNSWQQPIMSSSGSRVLLRNSTITGSSAGESTVLLGFIGPMGASVVVVRERHFVTVVRLSP
ncbi:hypothetical protein JJB74_32205 [Noviherbaspirillum sp. DKR-6]|uniref:Uncharacterized protein n=1 Tax=Noviherbaspirillum pedocola TaxID=2801341 RepID=A0A934T3H7_9BURK|nr:hypothetical protein [Noviherbaspirillum pedocola]